MKKIELSAKTKKILSYIGGAIAVVGAVAGTVYLYKKGAEFRARVAAHEEEGQAILDALNKAMHHPDDSVQIFDGIDKTGETVASLVVDSKFNMADIGAIVEFTDGHGNCFTTKTITIEKVIG